MTLIAGQDEREMLSTAVNDLVALGGTCLSLGVLKGLEVKTTVYIDKAYLYLCISLARRSSRTGRRRAA